MRSQVIENLEESPSEINSRYCDFLRFIENNPQHQEIVLSFSNQISKILDAWTKAGVTEEMLLRDLTCVKQVLEYPTVENIVALFEQSKLHGIACQTKMKVGASEAVGGSILGAGVYTLSALSLFSTPIGLGIGVGAAATGMIAGTCTAVDSRKKPGNLSQVEKKMIETIMNELFTNKDYKTYAAAVIGQEKINAQYRGSSQNCIEILTNCINALKTLNGNELKEICIKLNTTFNNLKGKHADTLKAIENLIHSFCEKMFEEENYKDFVFIKIRLILNSANCRNKNKERDNILVKLQNKILDMQDSKNFTEIRVSVESTITELNQESKNKNMLGLETSQSAKELKEMILDKLPDCRVTYRH